MAGLYIHIPFCAQRCAYCDFYSSVGNLNDRAYRSGFVEALLKEMEYRQGVIQGGKLDTIYIGGGTPSLLHPTQLQSLSDRASELWDCGSLKEVTLEANPEDLDSNYIDDLTRIGFNRLSIGIQSFDDRLLRLMNRRHSAQRAKDAVKAAQTAGFANITVDLIYGIPGMSPSQWERSLDEAIGLGIQHISAYHLTIEPKTVFGRMAEAGKMAPIDDRESEKQYETLCRKLGDAGFEHYEISNFALPGFRAIHNASYWNGVPYLGIGPSAHSYDADRTRSWVVADMAEYLRGVGTQGVYESETLCDKELFNEFVMTSLRRSDGLDLMLMEQKFGPRMAEDFIRQAERLLDSGEMLREGARIVIPPEKFLLSDRTISTFFLL